MVRILLVDDHPVVRRGLVAILSEIEPDFEVGEADSGEQALLRVQAEPWDVVLLDVSLPDRSGLQVLSRIKTLRPHLPVLMLSVYPVEQMGLRLVKAGAAGYLHKGCTVEQLREALHRVLQGGHYISKELAEEMARSLSTEQTGLAHNTLSNREFQVLQLIGEGHTPTQIATSLSLSVKTVHTYRTRILQKLGLKNTAGLIRYIYEQGLSSNH